MKKIISNIKGLTLMETTISLGILMFGVMATITLMLATFNSVQVSEQEIVVVNLAREGIEIVRGIRNSENSNLTSDVNIFDGSYDNASFILDSDDTNSSTSFNANNVSTAASISECSSCALYLDNGKYSHDPVGTATAYKRMITIEEGDIANEKRIISEVSWTTKSKTHTYTLEAYLTDWQ
jgi:Tfp pilus assembly protein PilV